MWGIPIAKHFPWINSPSLHFMKPTPPKIKRIERNPIFQKAISIPGSKSYANRALILAALSKDPCHIKGLPKALDTLDLIACLKRIGLQIHEGKDGLTIDRSFPSCETPSKTPIRLDSGEGGTTNRFLIPLLALGQNEYLLYPDPQVMKRPMDEFQRHIKSFEKKNDHFRIKGPQSSHSLKLGRSPTTQIASAFSLVGYDVQIPPSLPSLPYFLMTQEMVRLFDKEFCVPPDWSSAAFPLAFAALAGSVQIENIKAQDPLQADSALLGVLDQVGCDYEWNSKGLHIKKALKRPFVFDCTHSPDLFPALSFLASYLDGESSITGLQNLKYKESDRLEEGIKLLSIFGIPYHLEGHTLRILGQKPDQRARSVTTAKDHRLVMTAYLFLRLNGGGTLEPAHAVEKSFPEFFDLMGSS
ncbi:MAG: hypothetical protein OXB88_08440 [Bacteriovoracales bacterium]|nr:hypothetical protein [Bacteriovoracales bacterium]